MIISVAKGFDGTTDTGIGAGFLGFSSINNRFEKWPGTAWAALCSLFEINVRRHGGKSIDKIYTDLVPAEYAPDGMVSEDDLAMYDTSAEVDAKIAAIPLGRDGTEHTHDQYVTADLLSSYATGAYLDLRLDGLDVRVTNLESGNFDTLYYLRTEADGKFQPIGDYLTTEDAVTRSEAYLKGEIDSKFLDKKESLTTALADKIDADAGLADLSELTDAPDTYTGNAGKIVSVKSSEDGVEFLDREDAWSEISDDQQFYRSSWDLDGGIWAWRKQLGQYQFRGSVAIDNVVARWRQFTTTGNVFVTEAAGQIVPLPVERFDGTMTMAAARFTSASRIDIYIPEAIAVDEPIIFYWDGIALNS